MKSRAPDYWANRFVAFHATHPEFAKMFDRFALDLIRAGRLRFGGQTVAERLRWETLLSSGEDFKINDAYVPFYVRRFVHLHPQHRGVFEMRRSCADDLDMTAIA